MDQQLRVLVVGGVACGPKVACRLKRLDPSAEITILERGRDISYGACGMPYFISGMVDRIEALSETPVVHVVQNKLDGVARGISPLPAKMKIEKGEVTLLDVRSPQEFQEMGLPYDVVHIPLGALRNKCDEISRDKEVLAFCKVSLRGYEAQRILNERGFEEVSFIEGGLAGWPFELRPSS